MASPPPVPMDEARLAHEIARIIDKRLPRSAPAAKAAAPYWLGEEDDRAAVDSYALAQEANGASEANDAPSRPCNGAADQSSEARQNAAAATRSATMTVDWVKKARRQRTRARLRDVAGWTVSIAVSLGLVIAVGVAMFGWPQGGTLLKQLQVKSINVSAIDGPPSAELNGGDHGR